MLKVRPAILRLMLPGLCALAVAAVGPPAADPIDPDDAYKSAEELVPVRVLADVPHLKPGRTFHLAVVFQIAKDWHIYWKNPGTGGLATEVLVAAPEGYEVGSVGFPRPKRFRQGREITFGYENETVLFVPITPPKTIDSHEATFDCRISWLVCKKACKLGSAERSVTLAVTETPPREDPALPDPPLAKHFKRLPRPLKDLKGSKLAINEDRLLITGPMLGHQQVVFFPGHRPGVTLGEAQIEYRNDRFTIAVPFSVRPVDSLGRPMAIEGLIALGDRDDDPCYEFTVPLQDPPEVPSRLVR
ncbi:MAG: hypothetical protein JSV91_04750 [Phycisphaerales bacterium]|nr:MAG: hypothetical protein JSV91_04750 [Phycisphaerales bacterium]